MTSTPKAAGSGCHWGVSSTGITGYATLTLNGTSQNMESNTAAANDAFGYTVIEVSFDHRETANMDFWITGAAAVINATIASTTIPQPGDTVAITDSVDTGIAGTAWIAGQSTINRVNNDLAKCSVPLHRFAKIT